jgi:hypothetical protein
MEEKNLNALFMNVVMMFASVCWQHLGKTPNPMTNKPELDLKSAQFVIETMIMLKDKTKGNLSAEEDRLLTNTISDLQLNYADEVSKEKPADKPVN